MAASGEAASVQGAGMVAQAKNQNRLTWMLIAVVSVQTAAAIIALLR